jgi:hypothetical protein
MSMSSYAQTDSMQWLLYASISLGAVGDLLVMALKYAMLRKNCCDSLKYGQNIASSAHSKV